MPSVRAAAFDLLRARGITTVFGNPGSTELGFLADFPADFRYVLGLHEAVAVGMADGFAQVTGRPAFVNLHTASGVGNAMGAVVNAFHNRAPLVITAGNQDRRHLESEPYLFARATELMAPYVKSSREPRRAEDVPAAIDRAWQLAQTPPAGPVFVSVPMDDWEAEAAPSPPRHPISLGRAVDSAAVQGIRMRLADSARPGIVAGAGVDRDRAWADVVELAERLGAPVWAAPQAPRAGFPEDHPQFQGHLAPGYASAATQLAGCDLVLVLGAPVFSFLPYEPSAAELPPIVQVTDDPDEAARAPGAMSLVADVAGAARALLERLPARWADGEAPVAERPLPPMPAASEPIAPAYLMATLGQLLDPDTVLVEESPSNRAALRRHVRIRRPGSFFTTASGGLGFAMPAAVGIKLADPSRRVVCLVGDGSALYAPQALWSAVQLGLAITFVIVNNARYAILDAAAQFAGLGEHPRPRASGDRLRRLGRVARLPGRARRRGRCAGRRPGRRADRRGAPADRRRRRPGAPAASAFRLSEPHGARMNHDQVRLDPTEIGRTLDDLAAIGNRYAGTPGEVAARDYLFERFKALGLADVRLEPFRYLGYQAETASCAFDGVELECHPLQYTAAAEAAGEAIYLGDAGPADFERVDARGVDLTGKIAVAHSMFPFDLVGVLEERGIVGLVHICETPDGIVGNFTGALYPPPLEAPWVGRPTASCGVTISHPAGRALISELSWGRPVEVHHQSCRRLPRAHGAQRGGRRAGRRAGRGDPVGPLRQPGRGTMRLRQWQRPGQPAGNRTDAARSLVPAADGLDRLGGRGDRRVGCNRLCTRARA